MSRYPQDSVGRGSLKDIQQLINSRSDFLNKKLSNEFNWKDTLSITWVSPLEKDEFSEYRDHDLLRVLTIENLKVDLPGFWPSKGPQWDALGKSYSGDVFLVEAKANIQELVSSATKASRPSLDLIRKSLEETKAYLRIKNNINWSGKFYQYTNRIAHLYYLRVLNNISAYLVFVYFLNDKTVSGPESIKEWQAALTIMKEYLGIRKNSLSKYIADIFIDVNAIRR